MIINGSIFAALVCTLDASSHVVPGPESQAWFGAAIGWSSGGEAQQFIVGAPVSDGVSSTRPGEAFVYDAASQRLIWSFTGEADGDKFGTAVAGAGDLTGDGYCDWLVGAPGADEPGVGADTGRAYVFSGKDGSLITTITGGSVDDWFGYSVAAVGDLNGDGVPEFAVGARRPSGFGYVRVYCGATFQVIRELRDVVGATHFGMNIAGGGGALGRGDVDGDGINDLIVGAPFHSQAAALAGRVYVFSGADGSQLHAFDGEATLDFFGIAIAMAGDVDGDGHADVLVGADGNSVGGTNAGRAYVYSGRDGALLHVFTGTEQRARLGRGVARIGDVDGDGRADLLVGQPSPLVVGGSGIGRAFIFSGMTAELLHEFVATEIDDFFGFTVSGNPDAQAAQPSVLIGAFASDINGRQSGRVDLVHYRKLEFGDLNGDGAVDVSDLLILLAEWGPCGVPPADCPADFNSDLTVDASDLLILLSNW